MPGPRLHGPTHACFKLAMGGPLAHGPTRVHGTGVISNTHVYTERADDSAVTRLSSVSRNVLACNPKVFLSFDVGVK